MSSILKFEILLFIATIFTVATADLSPACIAVRDNPFIPNAAVVKACFDNYTIDESYVDVIIQNLELIGEYYPYVDINNNPPESDDLPFPVINYTASLEQLKATLKESNGQISKIFRPVMAFINSFHDAHFYLRMNIPNGVENILAGVYGAIPFFWNVVVDDDGKTRILLGPDQYTYMLYPDMATMLAAKLNDKVYVKSVDDMDAFDFFVNFFEEYDYMRFKQAKISNAIQSTANGFSLLRYPTENAFKPHTVIFDDDTNFTFMCAFRNIANSARSERENIPIPKDPIQPVSMEHEAEIAEKIKNFDFKRRHVSKRDMDNHTYLPCGTEDGMNYITISSFAPSDGDLYLEELAECVSYFYENDFPITIWMNHNGGGIAALEEITQLCFMTDVEYRIAMAVRKTEASRKVIVDKAYGEIASNLSNNCLPLLESDLPELWKDTYVDHYKGGIDHIRSEKFIMAQKDMASKIYQLTGGERLRDPTDIVVVTDGFCASGCGIFTYNAKRTGSAIIAGYGGTYPNESLFVLGQCHATTIDNVGWFDLKDNEKYGLEFGASFCEMYNISEKMDDLMPVEFDTPRIDSHLQYYDGASPTLDNILNKTKKLVEEYKTKCNPTNKALIYVTDKCKVKDPNALVTGYVCGNDGVWNKSDCRILTCQPSYILDTTQNKCIPDVCDGRFTPSSYSSGFSSTSKTHPESNSVIVNPMFGLIIAVISIISIIVH